MLISYLATALTLVALCGNWFRGMRPPFRLLYVWSLYCALAYVRPFGFSLLAYRWPMAVAFALVGLYWFARSRRPVLDRQAVFALLLIGQALLSSIYSRVPDYSLYRATALLLIFAFAFLGVRNLIGNEADLLAIFRCITVGSGMTMILLVASALIGGIHLSTDAYRFGGYLKATGVAQAICAGFPLLIWLAQYPLTRYRWLMLLGSLFLVYMLLAARSRFGFVAFIATAPLALLAIRFRLRLPQVAAAAVALWIVGGVLWNVLPTESLRTLMRLGETEEMFKTRVEGRWDVIWERAWERPLSGWGYGTVRFAHLTGEIDWKLEDGRMDQIMAHNEHLGLFHDLGLFPLLLFWIYLAAVCVQAVRLLNLRACLVRDLLVALWISWLVDALNTMSHDGLFTIGNLSATLFWIKGVAVTVGAVIVLGRREVDRYTMSAPGIPAAGALRAVPGRVP
jgi:O-antigen ligase